MKRSNFRSKLIINSFLLLFYIGFTACADQDLLHDHNSDYKNDSTHENCDISTIRRGRWSRKRIWDQNRLPKAQERVCINHRVSYDQDASQAVELWALKINQSLSFVTNRSTQLRVQDLYVMRNSVEFGIEC